MRKSSSRKRISRRRADQLRRVRKPEGDQHGPVRFRTDGGNPEGITIIEGERGTSVHTRRTVSITTRHETAVSQAQGTGRGRRSCQRHASGPEEEDRASLKTILADPSSGKALKDELAVLRSFRVGTFRVVYRLMRNVIEIVAIGPRGRIYEETYRLLKKERS